MTPPPEGNQSDAALARAARRGDRMAFAALHARFGRVVHAALLAKVPPGEAEDLVQDVFLTALRRIDTLSEEGAVGAWLVAIARNHATEFHRRSRPVQPLPDLLVGRSGPDGEEIVRAEEVLAAIRALPEAYRETLLLRLVEEMTGPEIAEAIGMTHGSVRVNLHRGMKLLRQRLSGRDR